MRELQHRLEGKTALVGAATGFGRALGMAEEGAQIVATDIDEQVLGNRRPLSGIDARQPGLIDVGNADGLPSLRESTYWAAVGALF